MVYYIYCKSNYKIYQQDFNSEDWSGFNHDAYTDHEFSISNKNKNLLNLTSSYETNIDNPYFVAVIFSDGGTFGRTDGNVQVLPPMSKNDAELIKSILQNKNQLHYQDEEFVQCEQIIKKYDKHKYIEFCGYFAEIQNVIILASSLYILMEL
jgi:hypothetical protein